MSKIIIPRGAGRLSPARPVSPELIEHARDDEFIAVPFTHRKHRGYKVFFATMQVDRMNFPRFFLEAMDIYLPESIPISVAYDGNTGRFKVTLVNEGEGNIRLHPYPYTGSGWMYFKGIKKRVGLPAGLRSLVAITIPPQGDAKQPFFLMHLPPASVRILGEEAAWKWVQEHASKNPDEFGKENKQKSVDLFGGERGGNEETNGITDDEIAEAAGTKTGNVAEPFLTQEGGKPLRTDKPLGPPKGIPKGAPRIPGVRMEKKPGRRGYLPYREDPPTGGAKW